MHSMNLYHSLAFSLFMNSFPFYSIDVRKQKKSILFIPIFFVFIHEWFYFLFYRLKKTKESIPFIPKFFVGTTDKMWSPGG